VAARTLRLEEFRETLEAVRTLPGLGPEMDALWDLRDLGPDHPVLEVEELKVLILTYGRDWARTPRTRAAILVSRTVDYGMARMGMVLMDQDAPDRVMVFRTLPEAHSWLEHGVLPIDLWGSSSPTPFLKPDCSRPA
jgi:hypothetical protein